MTKDTIIGFPPVVNNSSKILILGSMPGIKSLEANQYYAHPHNHFWKIIFTLTNTEPCDSYSSKKKLLLDNGIALWDVIVTCKRSNTSSDSKIQNAVCNDFNAFFRKYSSINKVFCNGKTSLKLFQKHFSCLGMPCDYLPSSSPAYAKTLKWKIDRWKIILDSN